MKRDGLLNFAGIELVLFAGIPPLLVCNCFLDPFSLIKRVVGDVFLCLLVLTLAYGLLSGRLKARLCVGHYLLFSFFLVSLVSILDAPDRYYGLRALTQVSGWLAAAVAGYQVLKGREESVRFIRALSFFALPVGLAGLYEVVTGSSYFMDLTRSGGRISSTFGAPTLFSGYVLMALFLAQGGFVIDSSKKYKLLYGALWLVMLVNLFKTGTLAAWAAFAAANVFFLWGVVRKAETPQSGAAPRKAFLFVVMVVLLVGLLWAFAGGGGDKGAFSARFNANKTESMAFRFQRWNVAIDLFKDNPALGAGSGMFGVYYPLYIKQYDSKNVGISVDSPENLFLSVLAETGATGCVVLVGILLFSLFIVVKRRKKGSSGGGLHTLAFGCAAAAVLMYSMFHSPLHTEGVWGLFWVCVAGFWGGESGGGEKGQESPAADTPVFLAVAIVMLFSAVFSVSFMMKEYHVYRAVRFYEGKRLDKASVEIGKAMKLSFGKDWNVLNIAGAISAGRNSEEAYGYYERAARLRPFDSDLYYEMFNVVDKDKRADEAIDALNTIIDINPNAVNAYMLRATQYERMGRYGDAAKDLEVYLDRKSDASWREHYLLYLCMTRSGVRDVRKEMKALQRTVNMNPDSYLPYYQMGLYYSAAGDSDSAKRMLRRALELNPGSKEAAEALKRFSYVSRDYNPEGRAKGPPRR